jgi:carboxypeptidase Taq
VHWSTGAFGYFPTYSLGNLYAAQLFEQIEKEIPNLDAVLQRGELKKITDWLNRKIHKLGRLKTADELIVDVTGKPLSEKAFATYLRKKYLG